MLLQVLRYLWIWEAGIFREKMRWQELQNPKISSLTLGKALYMPYLPYVLWKELQAPSSGESSQVLVTTPFF